MIKRSYPQEIGYLEAEEQRIWQSYRWEARQEELRGEEDEGRTYRNSPRPKKTKKSTKILAAHKRHVEAIMLVHDRHLRQLVEG